jgi:hypothetical protein
MDLRRIGWEGVQWIQVAQDRDRWRVLVNTVMKLRVLAPRSYLQWNVNVRKVTQGSASVMLLETPVII